MWNCGIAKLLFLHKMEKKPQNDACTIDHASQISAVGIHMNVMKRTQSQLNAKTEFYSTTELCTAFSIDVTKRFITHFPGLRVRQREIHINSRLPHIQQLVESRGAN